MADIRSRRGSRWDREGEGYMHGGGRDLDDRDYGYGWDYGRGRDVSGRTYGATVGSEPRPSYRGRGPKNYHRSDERIREEVCERLTDDDRVDASDMEVAVQECVVTLTGSVPDRDMKRRAEDIAESVNSVRDVQNQVRVTR